MIHEHSAGGVVFRRNQHATELLLIRDRYGRWTLAKGGIEPGETPEQAALREILEETGVRGEILSLLGTTRYWYSKGDGQPVNKVVDYFLVRATSFEITPALGEIDCAEWFPVEKAVEMEGYANNRQVISRAVEMLSRNPGQQAEL